ncbi:MAG: tRNA preQ1(34) S-adenosylmethionine ribosyltransferase-isomerase QueA [Candidatus Omnitrophica bacterium]|nr:tRNA preQ1(34) S-adenosylmethionine ribosyltransferase-isomerase QueA [Candidatus Omnitrophota bacterium]
MELSDFQYDLPLELIAQKPLNKRDSSRLMVLERGNGGVSHRVFSDITQYLREGDCLVVNDTRVIPVRLFGNRGSGGRVEIFLLDTTGSPYKALVKPSARIKEGEIVHLEGGGKATVLGRSSTGRSVVFDRPIEAVLEKGHVPLPPYINRPDSGSDRNDYQTVYAARNGATASPTAGLHFTDELLSRIRDMGVIMVSVTLHTSYGTFAPVKVNNIMDHVMHFEHYEIQEEAADTINRSRKAGGRVFAVGTTSTRVLETVAGDDGLVRASKGETNLFIYPSYKFKITSSIITNFHLPGSTLLMLVSAFAGRDFILGAYRSAVEKGYRFFSYGDAMLIL